MNELSWLDKLLSDPVAIATLLLALVTLVLAGAAVWSILQTNSIRKAERRERLLNEITQWVKDISKCWPKEIHKDLAETRDKLKRQELLAAQIAVIKDMLVEMRGRNHYAKSIAMKLDKQLERATINLTGKVEQYVEFLTGWRTTILNSINKNEVADNGEYFEQAKIIEHELEEHVNKVMDEAAEINTRDIA